MYKLFGSNFEITIDAGCVIIKQTEPQAGQIILHASEVNSILFGMLNRAAEEAKRLASLPRVVRAESFQRIARHFDRLSWAKVASGVVASNKKPAQEPIEDFPHRPTSRAGRAALPN
jgi:hypothetical protein